jgi:hypothetical protein
MSPNGESKLAKSEDVKTFIQRRLRDSLSGVLLKLGVKYGTTSSEKLIWELLLMLVDNEGSVCHPYHPPSLFLIRTVGDQ